MAAVVVLVVALVAVVVVLVALSAGVLWLFCVCVCACVCTRCAASFIWCGMVQSAPARRPACPCHQARNVSAAVALGPVSHHSVYGVCVFRDGGPSRNGHSV